MRDDTELPVPGTRDGQAGLAALLADPGRALIAFDFDGTLAPIVPDPADARVLPAALTALRALAPLVGTVAVVTGRPARTAVEYGSLDQVPGIVVLGHYGRQRWHDGELDSPPPPPGLALARERLPAVLAAAGAETESGPRTRPTPSPCTPAGRPIRPPPWSGFASRCCGSPVRPACGPSPDAW